MATTNVNTALGQVAFGDVPVFTGGGLSNEAIEDLRLQLQRALDPSRNPGLIGDAGGGIPTVGGPTGGGDFGGEAGNVSSGQPLTETSNLAGTDPNRILEILAQLDDGTGNSDFEDIDDLITGRSGQAIDLLTQGSNEQLRLSRAGTEAGAAPLEALQDFRAFDEQQAILGLSGQAAQEAAIGNIPVSQFDQELNRRQKQQLLRGASASGEIGGGATLAAGAQLAGAQQSDIIQRRLADLEPAVTASRGLASSISGIREQGRVTEAGIQSGLATQAANIRLGVVAPQIQSSLNEAELSGLAGISSAQRSGQTATQLAGLAGIFAGQF